MNESHRAWIFQNRLDLIDNHRQRLYPELHILSNESKEVTYSLGIWVDSQPLSLIVEVRQRYVRVHWGQEAESQLSSLCLQIVQKRWGPLEVGLLAHQRFYQLSPESNERTFSHSAEFGHEGFEDRSRLSIASWPRSRDPHAIDQTAWSANHDLPVAFVDSLLSLNCTLSVSCHEGLACPRSRWLPSPSSGRPILARCISLL